MSPKYKPPINSFAGITQLICYSFLLEIMTLQSTVGGYLFGDKND